MAGAILTSPSSSRFAGRGNGERWREKSGAGYEVNICFMPLDVSEKYQPQIRLPLEHGCCNASDKKCILHS